MAGLLSLMRDPGHALTLGLGTGLSARAPGTFGTLAAVPLYFAMSSLPVLVYLAVTMVLFAAGVWLCERTANAMGVHDHPAIVFDEIVGYLLVMIAAPATPLAMALGFLLFRIFDIAKPWPIRWVDERVTGGFGIMLDDALAAIPAAVLLHLTLRFI